MKSIWHSFLLLFLIAGTLTACGGANENSGSTTAEPATGDAAADADAGADYPEEKLGWHLGSQAYTFKNFTFSEALDKIDSCGLKYVEAFPGQMIGGGIEGKMDYKMSPDTRDRVLAMVKEKGMVLYGFGVVSPESDQDWHSLFEFAKAMGITTITSEPEQKYIALVDSLCKTYQINLAIHNHPKPSIYWNPEVVKNAISGRSERLGACADIGHWVRSGLEPVESLKLLEGRVLHSHMKDLNEKGKKEAHDVHWGQGVSGIKAVIEELKRQNFKGMISVEYEHNWDNSVPDVIASVKFFRSSLD